MFKNGLCTHFLPPANEVWGKVMFSHVFVCPQGWGFGFLACITGHMTREDGGSASRGAYHQGVGRPPIHAMLRIWSRRGRYASYSNAFLLGLRFLITVAMDKDRIRNHNHVINRSCE